MGWHEFNALHRGLHGHRSSKHPNPDHSGLGWDVAAMARKLVVAIWYLLMGKWTTLQEVDSTLSCKVSKIITEVGAPVLKQLNKTRKDLRESAYNLLKTGRTYVLDPNKMFTPKAKPDTQQGGDSSLTLAQEYGVA